MAVTATSLETLTAMLSARVRHTPLVQVAQGAHLKLESLQPTGSFKVRGFFAAALGMPEERRRGGLMTVSAGNAALACAYVARELGVSCRVVMFDTAPKLKVEGVRALGADIIFMAREQLYAWMQRRAWEDEREVFIHPFADDSVIAGHGTLAAEIHRELPEVDTVLVPVGGGGLICGVAEGFAALGADVKVVGVQSEGYPLWSSAFRAGGPVALTPDTIADGTTAPFDVGMFERLQRCVHEWILVPEALLREAVVRMAMQLKVVAEGAGALAYAALTMSPRDGCSVAVLSGGNIDAGRLASLLSLHSV